MLPRMCPKLPWRKRLVTIVHGLSPKPAGAKPKDTIREGVARVTTNSITFSAISIHTGFKLDLL